MWQPHEEAGQRATEGTSSGEEKSFVAKQRKSNRIAIIESEAKRSEAIHSEIRNMLIILIKLGLPKLTDRRQQKSRLQTVNLRELDLYGLKSITVQAQKSYNVTRWDLLLSFIHAT